MKRVLANKSLAIGIGIAAWAFLATRRLSIDLDDRGIPLTDPGHGVVFDIAASGKPVRVSWTPPGSGDAFLALDRNNNGTIDDGSELFGNHTTQPPTTQKGGLNGFLALAEFDRVENGGNGDGWITEDDAVYSQPRLWIDSNHDGVSQPGELKTLAECGVRAIALHYTLAKLTDASGNQFRFRSHAIMDRDLTQSGPIRRAAVDVILRWMPNQ